MQIFSPAHLGELLSTYSTHPDALLIAGGIEVMRGIEKASRPGKIIDLTTVAELKRISRTERHMDIGPTLPVSHILSIGRHVIPRVLHDALHSISAPAIRNVATLGGNLCKASPYSDSLTALFALEALLELKSYTTTRWVPVSKFVLDQGKTDLRKGEILTRIRIPLKDWSIQVFRTVPSRGNPYLSSITFCGLAYIMKGVIQDIRFSVGSINPTVIRDRKLETPLIGHKLPLQEREIKIVRAALSELMVPIADSPLTGTYQTETSLRMVHWFLKELDQLNLAIR
jgi:xanthine dehydrogenase FAD-binding subunit